MPILVNKPQKALFRVGSKVKYLMQMGPTFRVFRKRFDEHGNVEYDIEVASDRVVEIKGIKQKHLIRA